MESSSFLFWIVLILGLIYIGYCGYLHSEKKVVFFYSFLDVAITVINPVIVVIIMFLTNEHGAMTDTTWRMIILSTVLMSTAVWTITYRANSNNIRSTVLIFCAKILLGILLLGILIISLLAYIYWRPAREKYERKKKYADRAEKIGRNAAGVVLSLFTTIAFSCCSNYDFSYPEKLGNTM